MVTPRETFQSLLRELFQFDLADLDFGIYRLFRRKKDELDKFINEQIPQAVEKAFADLAEGDTGKLKAEVADLAEKIREELELDAILDDGSLNPRYDKAAMGRDRASKRVLVVWRDATGLDPKAERAFLDKQVATLTKNAPFDRMLINGDNAAGFESLDLPFKQLMEAD